MCSYVLTQEGTQVRLEKFCTKNFVNVVRVQIVLLLMIGKEKRGQGYMWIVDDENLAKELREASGMWMMGFLSLSVLHFNS